MISARESFQTGTTIKDSDLKSLNADLRAPTKGNITSWKADDDGGLDKMRYIINLVRRKERTDLAGDIAKASVAPGGTGSTAEDLFKPLPPSDLDPVWSAADTITSGYLSVPDKYRVSSALVSRMVRANRVGNFWLPAIGSSFKYDETEVNRSVSELMRGASSDYALQMVQRNSERYDECGGAVHYIEMLDHRTAAVLGVFCSAAGSTAFKASTKGIARQAHARVAAQPGMPAGVVQPPATLKAPKVLQKISLRDCAELGIFLWY